VVLGSAHVLARRGLGLPGSDNICSQDDDLRVIARLADSSGPVVTTSGYLNWLDAALAAVTDPELDDAIGGWGPPRGSDRITFVGMNIFACGAVSGPQGSVIREQNWQGQIAFAGLGSARFSGLIRAAPPYGTFGDSGAAVLNDDMEVIGLHVATDHDADVPYSLFCPIQTILEKWPDLRIGADP
jgi:hypothetical protein